MFKQLSCSEAEQLMHDSGAVILDIRDEESYTESHIPQAIHSPMPVLQEFSDTADKDQPVLVYCYHGNSSQAVANYLVEQGFTSVFSLIGGYEKWSEYASR